MVDDHAVTARIDVVIRGEDTSNTTGNTTGNRTGNRTGTTCTVRALADDHTVVGEVSFTPEPGRNEVEVRTERRATSVESVGCTTPDQPRPR